jgi:hypothetical protein
MSKLRAGSAPGGTRKLAASSGALGFEGWTFAAMAEGSGGSQEPPLTAEVLYSSEEQGADMAAVTRIAPVRKAEAMALTNAAREAWGQLNFNLTQEYLYLYSKLHSGQC